MMSKLEKKLAEQLSTTQAELAFSKLSLSAYAWKETKLNITYCTIAFLLGWIIRGWF